MARSLIAALLVALPVSAQAGTIYTLPIDPTRSQLVITDVNPLFGPVPLSGTISLELFPDPLSAADSFRMVSLEATGPGGVVMSLDEDAADPGSGQVAFGAGGIGALFVQSPILLDDLTVPGFLSGPFAFSPPIIGVAADPALTTLRDVAIQVDFVELGDLRLLNFAIFAVPEPGSSTLFAFGLVVLARRRAAPAQSREAGSA